MPSLSNWAMSSVVRCGPMVFKTLACPAILLAAFAVPAVAADAANVVLDWPGMKAVARIDPRYMSYNLEMVEVTGGRFWAPYPSSSPAPQETLGLDGLHVLPPGVSAGLKNAFAERLPLDFSDRRLRNLTQALSPAYVRVSGSWANATYFDDGAVPAAVPPKGYGSVLSKARWDAVNQFSNAVGADLVTSFAVSQGTRNEKGEWTPDNAERWLRYSASKGYRIAAAEFYNEATVSTVSGLPPKYSGTDFARDYAVFRDLRDKVMPEMRLIGPSSAGEMKKSSAAAFPVQPSTDEILTATGPAFSAFSYHFYPSLSQRCAFVKGSQTTLADAMKEEFLSSTERSVEFYEAKRDKYLPGIPMWLTETAGAGCGGNPWSSTFLDSFRFVEQLGRLAKRGTQVVMHNTLVASDYGMIDEHTLTPRPNFWAAVLWRRTMGEVVLSAPTSTSPKDVNIYAHCLKGGKPGAAALMVVNLDIDHSKVIELGRPYLRYTLSASHLQARTVLLNGAELAPSPDGSIGKLDAIPGQKKLEVPPASISFIEVPDAQVPACRSPALAG